MADVWGNVAAFLTVVGILAGTFYVGRSGNQRATIRDQKERIESLDGLVTTKDRELIEERAKIAALEVRFNAVETKAYELSEIVSGRVDYSALETIAAGYHAEIMRAITDLDAALHDIKKLVEARRVGDQRER